MRPTTALTVALLGSSTASASVVKGKEEKQSDTHHLSARLVNINASTRLMARDGASSPPQNENEDITAVSIGSVDFDGKDLNDNTQHKGGGRGGGGSGGGDKSSPSNNTPSGGGGGAAAAAASNGVRPDIMMVGGVAAGVVVMGLGALLG